MTLSAPLFIIFIQGNTMKLQIKLIVISALALSINSAFAADTATMKVTGTLVAPSCDVTMNGKDTADFGSIPRSSLSATNNSPLTGKSQSLSVKVTCQANTAIAIKTSDANGTNKPTDARSFDFDGTSVSLPSNQYYNLGKASNDKPIGAYAIKIGTVAVIDGAGDAPAAKLRTGVDKENLSDATGPVYFDVNAPVISPANAASQSIPGTSFTFPLTVAGNISATDTLPNEVLTLDGNASIEVIYL